MFEGETTEKKVEKKEVVDMDVRKKMVEIFRANLPDFTLKELDKTDFGGDPQDYELLHDFLIMAKYGAAENTVYIHEFDLDNDEQDDWYLEKHEDWDEESPMFLMFFVGKDLCYHTKVVCEDDVQNLIDREIPKEKVLYPMQSEVPQSVSSGPAVPINDAPTWDKPTKI